MDETLFKEYCDKIHNKISDDKIKQLNRKVWYIEELNIIIKLYFNLNPYELFVIEDIKKKLPNYAKYIPNVLNTYRINKRCYAAIEYIQGTTLGEFLKTNPPPSIKEVKNIALELKDFLINLRKYKQPYCTNLPESGDKKLKDDIIRNMDFDEIGVYTSPNTFKALIKDYVKRKVPDFIIDLAFENIPDSVDCVLTHSDIYCDNIIVKDGKLVAIIDWEQCGYYPSYWEGFKGCLRIVEFSEEEYLFFRTALYDIDISFYSLTNIYRYIR